MNSSNDRVKPSKAAAITPGAMTGSVTRRNVVNSPAPRSIEASMIERSKCLKRVRTTAHTNEIMKAEWLRITECDPSVSLISE